MDIPEANLNAIDFWRTMEREHDAMQVKPMPTRIARSAQQEKEAWEAYRTWLQDRLHRDAQISQEIKHTQEELEKERNMRVMAQAEISWCFEQARLLREEAIQKAERNDAAFDKDALWAGVITALVALAGLIAVLLLLR